jgi:hypothetical protein
MTSKLMCVDGNLGNLDVYEILESWKSCIGCGIYESMQTTPSTHYYLVLVPRRSERPKADLVIVVVLLVIRVANKERIAQQEYEDHDKILHKTDSQQIATRATTRYTNSSTSARYRS